MADNVHDAKKITKEDLRPLEDAITDLNLRVGQIEGFLKGLSDDQGAAD